MLKFDLASSLEQMDAVFVTVELAIAISRAGRTHSLAAFWS